MANMIFSCIATAYIIFSTSEKGQVKIFSSVYLEKSFGGRI
jgi:hypothetical protein